MCCFLILLSGFGPRIALLAWWIFGDKVDLVFDSWIWPLLGLLLLPWTTLMYVIAWSAIGGVDGAGWLLVAVGVALDVASYGARSAQSRYATTV
jgi:hypothetical protein